jgi:Ca2+-binding EF-hand superfamily protein
MGRAATCTRIGGDDAKKETEMKRNLTIALAFLALSGAVGGIAYAKDGGGKRHGGERAGAMMPSLDLADADKNGEITLEEFTKVATERFTTADADKNGQLTVAEVSAEIEKMRTERMATRMIERLDGNGDGTLSAEEAQSGQKKIFALLDKNDDGKIAANERPRGMKRGMGGDDAPAAPAPEAPANP